MELFTRGGLVSWIQKYRQLIVSALIYLSWTIAIVSMLGSLYFSDILHYPPCVLCWWQRVFMYPIVFLIGVGIVLKDRSLPYYILPLALIGTGVALYQNLLIWGVITEKLSPCSLGVSCTTTYIQWFGFISIPFLSLLAFMFITAAMIATIVVTKTHDQRS